MNLDNLSIRDICQFKHNNLSGIKDVELVIIKFKCESFLLNKDRKLTDTDKLYLGQTITNCKAQLEVLRQKRLKR